MYGMLVRAGNGVAYNHANLISGYFTSIIGANGGSATLTQAVLADAGNISSGATVTTANVIRISDASGAGTIGTTYGILIDDLTKASTNYAIKTGQGLVEIGDDTEILGTLKVGNSPNYAYIEPDGTFRLTGSATAWDDLRVDGLSTRVGVVAPTDETGFRGDNNFYARNFVHTQADEIQFQVQFPHDWAGGTLISPHVHFSPWITGTASVQAVKFILEYYWANVYDDFPASPSTYSMEYTWTGSKQWSHLIAEHSSGDLDASGYSFSNIMKCRLYRDNTVANNLAGKATFLYFDIHYQRDSFGTSQEYTK